jgi:16S rRNA (uracil1498-N3)-methyltransferase
MADRYFSDIPITLGSVALDGPEAHHLIHVMRATRGTRVVLFDGSGAEFPAVVERVGRSDVQLNVLDREEICRELPFELTLGAALPKGDRQKWLVEKLVELGVTRMVPLRMERGVAQPVEQALSRLQRAVIETSKQCGRNRLMTIGDPQLWLDFVDASQSTPCRWVAQPSGMVDQIQFPTSEEPCSHVVAAVGPEGGFSPNEVSLASAAGWIAVDLGPRILRVETAALVLASMITTAYRPQMDRNKHPGL